MTELGKLLREKREEKGISLEELQTTTKIQKRYLLAIEEGNYDVLPGAFYARAFIKNYSEALGLHYETIFEEYSHEIPQAVKETTTEFSPRSKRERSTMNTSNPWIKRVVPIALIGILIILVLFIIFKLLPDGNDNAKSSKENDPGFEASLPDEKLKEDKKDSEKKKAESKKDDKNDTSSSEEKAKPEQTLTKLETSGYTTTFELSNTDQLIIDLSTSGDSYIGITDETNKSYEASILKAGDTKQYDLSQANEVTLNIGASHVTSIKINGEPFTYPVAPTEKVHQKIVIKKAQ